MGQIGDFVAWFDAACERTLANGGVVSVDSGALVRRAPKGPPKNKVRVSNRASYFERVCEFLRKHPGASAKEGCERVGCALSTWSHAKAVMRGQAWAKVPGVVKRSVGARRRALR